MNDTELRQFGLQYAKDWSSLVAENTMSYQAAECVLTVNDGEAAITADERYAVIAGFMEAFPGMTITLRDIAREDRGTVFYWNLKGSNSGPGGTGRRVDSDGCEVWTPDADGKTVESKGYFDAEEYRRQVDGE